MQKSFLVKSPVHFADFGFFVKVGDILVHDTSNANKLTVYRNGEIVKAVKQTSLGIAAMVKSGFVVEVVQSPKAAPKPKAAPAPGVPISKPNYDKLKENAKKPEPKKEASAVNWGADMSKKKELEKKPKPKLESPPIEDEDD